MLAQAPVLPRKAVSLAGVPELPQQGSSSFRYQLPLRKKRDSCREPHHGAYANLAACVELARRGFPDCTGDIEQKAGRPASTAFVVSNSARHRLVCHQVAFEATVSGVAAQLGHELGRS